MVLHCLEGPSPTYNIPVVVHLTGDLDQKALAAALGDVATRHEPLRTIFPDQQGTTHQLILEADQARPELTVSHVSEHELEKSWLRPSGTVSI